MKTIYLALPISGRSYDDVVRDITTTKRKLIAYYRVIHPMTGKEAMRNEIQFKAQGYTTPVSSNHAIYERDRWMVGTADIVLFNFLSAGHVSIGSMFELAWAAELGKLTIVVMQPTNIHQHAFVLEAADVVFDNMDDAVAMLSKLAE